jgi:ABC transport system ATP-binding/permease protein
MGRAPPGGDRADPARRRMGGTAPWGTLGRRAAAGGAGPDAPAEPDLLLLDEPTNHLDAATVLWLEETIFDFRGTVVLVTHDRYFLDRVVDRMVEVTPGGSSPSRGATPTTWRPGWSGRPGRRWRRQKRRRSSSRRSWPGPGARPRPARGSRRPGGPGRRSWAWSSGSGSGIAIREVELEVAEAPRLGRKILELEGVSKSYEAGGSDRGHGPAPGRGPGGDRGAERGGEVHASADRGGGGDPDRGVVSWARTPGSPGSTRSGPSIRTSRWGGRSRPPTGWRWRAEDAPAGLPGPVPLPVARARPAGERAFGGERNRLLLARLFLEEFNLLLLDEPTNDLDLDTLQVLEDLLDGLQGCLLVVSHDRYLLDKVCTSLLVFEGGGAGPPPGAGITGAGTPGSPGRRPGPGSEEARRKEAERKERESRAEAARVESRAAGDRRGID